MRNVDHCALQDRWPSGRALGVDPAAPTRPVLGSGWPGLGPCLHVLGQAETIATISEVVDGNLELVTAGFAELEEAAGRNAEAYGLWRHRYEGLHFLLGVPATVLAGVAGVTAFAQSVPGVVVGTCAALAAALAGIQTVVRPDRRARFNQTQQLALARLATQAKNYRLLAVPSASLDEARARLDALSDEYHTVLARSPD